MSWRSVERDRRRPTWRTARSSAFRRSSRPSRFSRSLARRTITSANPAEALLASPQPGAQNYRLQFRLPLRSDRSLCRSPLSLRQESACRAPRTSCRARSISSSSRRCRSRRCTGWGISNRIQQLSRDAFQIGQGSLYPALYRLEKKGWVRSDWRTTENNREAKYYQLTAAGRRQLGDEIESWRYYAGAVDLVIDAE